MLLERTTLQDRLAEIVAMNLPGHGGDEAERPGDGTPPPDSLPEDDKPAQPA